MNRLSLIFAICVTATIQPGIGQDTLVKDSPVLTAIDHYVAKTDDSYSWKIISDHTESGLRRVVVDMVSQTWRTADEVDRPKWQHWLLISIPAKSKSNIGMLFISGGGNGGNPPSGPDERTRTIAKATGTVVAELKMVPNQALVFHHDGERRTEDDLVAYTWNQFLKTGDATWPARNPMVKSAVRAMDTITAVTSTDKSQSNQTRVVEKFVIAGASKRGWTTWLTGAVDDRVVGIIPIVIDVLNTQKNMNHHFAAYGFWAPSVGDYVDHRITQQMNHPRMPALLKLVDPWFYRDRLTMPKFILNASGDQFFPPDSSRYYFDDLIGPKHLRYVPNADHSLKNSDAVESLIAYYGLIVAGKPAPEFSWTMQADGAIRVTTADKPKEVRLWQATNPDARDFRLESLGPKYTSTLLSGETEFVGKIDPPTKGWTAYFVELTYDVGGPVPLKVTTDVHIIPDVLPFADKDSSLPYSITLRCVAPNENVANVIKMATHSDIIRSVATDMFFSKSEPANGSPKINVRLNWKPVGRLGSSAESVIGWLKDQGCTDFGYRLESGSVPKEVQ